MTETIAATHAQYQPLLEPYYARLEEQEAFYVAAGIERAEGLAAFMRKWMQAWEAASSRGPGSLDELSDCMTDDIHFVEQASTFGRVVHSREMTLEFCAELYRAMPDTIYYPQDDSERSLPYWDFAGAEVRCTWPWRGIGRWTGPMRHPISGAIFPPLGVDLDYIGIDRYLITPDWKVRRIDTDWDSISQIMRALGIPFDVNGRGARMAGRIATAAAPAVRAGAAIAARTPLLRAANNGG